MYKKVQGNGSITIPSVMRHRLGIEARDAMELVELDNGDITLKRCNPQCIWCESENEVIVIKGVRMCMECYRKIKGGDKDGTCSNEG